MTPRRVLLYGGTFDPPHRGHMHNLRAVIAAVQPDIALVMPAAAPPHKSAADTPAGLRLAMCACFRAVDPRVTVSDWEIAQGGRSYTVRTLEMLAEKYPGAALYLGVGSDMLRSFAKWYRWQDILHLATLAVQSRLPGDGDALRAAARALEQAGGRVLFTGENALECSSTAIRAALAAGDASVWPQLPPEAADVIKRYGLYGTPKTKREEAYRP